MTDDERLRWRVSWWRVVVPWPLFFRRVLGRARQVNVLQLVREIHLSYTLALLVFGLVLAYIVEPESDPPLFPLVLSGVALLMAVGGARWLTRKPWPDDAPPEVLASIYRTTYFLHAAFAMSIALWGFVDVFITGWLWPYLAGGTVAFVWLWLIGPTSTNISRLDRKLREANPAASLVEGLTAPPDASA